MEMKYDMVPRGLQITIKTSKPMFLNPSL